MDQRIQEIQCSLQQTKIEDQRTQDKQSSTQQTKIEDESTAIIEQALQLFATATSAEENMDLDTAMKLYQKAYALERNIEQIYYDRITKNEKSQHIDQIDQPVESKETSPQRQNQYYAPTLHTQPILAWNAYYEQRSHYAPKIGETRKRTLPASVTLKRTQLPIEIMILILSHLVPTHHQTLQVSCSRVSKWMLNLVRSNELWRVIAETSSQIHMPYTRCGDYRWAYITLPRVRTEGIYISRYRYMRSGRSDIAWSQPEHTVTYYRYLRLFPNGMALSAMSALPPIDLVALLSLQTLKLDEAGDYYVPSRLPVSEVTLALGFYTFCNSTLSILTWMPHYSSGSSLLNVRLGRRAQKRMETESRIISMEFNIESSAIGAQNRLQWKYYASRNSHHNPKSLLAVFQERMKKNQEVLHYNDATFWSGDICSYKLDQTYPPFWFSPVKRYMNGLL